MMATQATMLFVRVFAKQFYRSHASLFFLIIAFAGGFMRAQDHIALGEFFIAVPVLAMIPVGVWIAYGLFVLNYNTAMMKNGENTFARTLFLFPDLIQYLVVAAVIAIQLVPALLYCFFLFAITIRSNLIAPLFVFGGGFFQIFFACTFYTRWLIIRPREWSPVLNNERTWFSTFAKPFPHIVLKAALRKQAIAIIGYKLMSIVILLAAFHIYSKGNYDLRLINLAVLVSFMAGISFILEWHYFENHTFPIFRRMPLSSIKRMGYAFIIIVLVTLPEIFILVRNFRPGTETFDLLVSIGFGISMYLFWYSFLYVRDWKRERIVSVASLAGIAIFIAILADTPPSVLLAVHLLSGTFLFLRYYTRFEYRSDALL